jgi:putative oxidoreductase
MLIRHRSALAFIAGLERYGTPLADLLVRLVVFRVFFWSGLVKIHDWPGTVQLFQYEYMVPWLPPPFAAILAAGFELGASSLILVGFATRLAVLPLLGMSMVIQFVLGAANPAYNQLEHYLWMVLLLQLLVRGPGLLSLDYWFRLHANKANLAVLPR